MVTATVESLTLAKALAVKNRLVGRLTQARSNIETYNSVLVGQAGESSIDVRAEFQRYLSLQDAVVRVKSVIQRANMPLLEDIFKMSEVKDRLKLLSGLNTKSGSEPSFNGLIYTYVTTYTKAEVLEMIRRLEAEIDTIQDRLNAHNATTRVDLEAADLELAR